MAGKSDIEWTGHTWNPIAGCSVLSPGCTNCYAMRQAARLERFGQPLYAGLTRPSKAGPVWTGELRLAPEHVVYAPFNRRVPTTYFVNSMSDLFHEDVPDEWLSRIFSVMVLSPQHTFQVLTKRAHRMREFVGGWANWWNNVSGMAERGHPWPLPHIWLGVSAEDQKRADERIPDLLATPAAVRFVSAEPLLGPIRFCKYCPGQHPMMDGRKDPRFKYHAFVGGYGDKCGLNGLDWIIVGGESGPGAREFHVEWAESIVDQCRASGRACFVKQVGARPRMMNIAYVTRDRKGGEPSEWPQSIRVREMPEARP